MVIKLSIVSYALTIVTLSIAAMRKVLIESQMNANDLRSIVFQTSIQNNQIPHLGEKFFVKSPYWSCGTPRGGSGAYNW